MIDSGTVLFVASVIVAIIAILTFVASKQKKTAEDAEWRGRFEGKLDSMLGISVRVEKLECVQNKHGERIAVLEAVMPRKKVSKGAEE